MFLLKSALAVSAAVIAFGPAAVQAQTYPDRAVEFIVPFAPGGGADASQRAFNKYAEQIVGKPLPIVNKPGAGGATGWAELVRAKPDGYTLAVITPPFDLVIIASACTPADLSASCRAPRYCATRPWT